jgi:hypothetical protein
MTAVCPAGHTSASDDYCDVCGVPIEAGAPAAAPDTPAPPTDAPTLAPLAAGQQPCPNCSTPNADDALFCENCGYDFTTGTMPRPLTPPEGLTPPDVAPEAASAAPGTGSADGTEAPAAPAAPDAVTAPFAFVAEVWIDPAWYEAQESPDTMPSPGLPEVVALRSASNLIGRVSNSRNIHPEIDCGSDSGVSRRQTQLTTDGTRWWVEDLESANGTFVGPASGALPEDPIPVGAKRELAADDRIYVGAWTRIVVRPATEDEQATLG